MPDETERLASIAAVTDELDATLDRLFATVAQLKELLLPPPPDPEPEPENKTEEHP